MLCVSKKLFLCAKQVVISLQKNSNSPPGHPTCEQQVCRECTSMCCDHQICLGSKDRDFSYCWGSIHYDWNHTLTGPCQMRRRIGLNLYNSQLNRRCFGTLLLFLKPMLNNLEHYIILFSLYPCVNGAAEKLCIIIYHFGQVIS